eukprot:2658933-Amphidinium_carterae.1
MSKAGFCAVPSCKFRQRPNHNRVPDTSSSVRLVTSSIRHCSGRSLYMYTSGHPTCGKGSSACMAAITGGGQNVASQTQIGA